jgi:hypothetical protein
MTQRPPLPSPDQVLASAARFLIDGREEQAADVLLSCSLELSARSSGWHSGGQLVYETYVTVSGPRSAYDILIEEYNPISEAVVSAFRAVIPHPYVFNEIIVRSQLVEIGPDWKPELLEIARGRDIHNQDADGAHAKTWMNLRFGSESEVRVAKVLDQRGVLYFPNCKGRLNTPQGRANRKPDFLICYQGKWGILEVDGEWYHPPSRAAQDHDRDRLFQMHGVRLTQHYTAKDCFDAPHKVVDGFLKLLANS